MNLTHADLFETVLERVRDSNYAFDAKSFCHKLPNDGYPKTEAEASFNGVAADAITWFALSIEGRTTGWSLGDLGVPVREDFSGTSALAEFLDIHRDEAARLIYLPTPDDRDANASDALEILREIRAKYEAQGAQSMITPGYRFERHGHTFTVLGKAYDDYYYCVRADGEGMTSAALDEYEIKCAKRLAPISTIASLTSPGQPLIEVGDVWSYRGSNYHILRVHEGWAEIIATDASNGDTVRSVFTGDLEECVGHTVLEPRAA